MSFASASPAQPRNQVADLLKGVAVVLMIQVHLIEQFATLDLYKSTVGRISLFLGGPPAAPVFLAVMGYFLASTRKTLPQLLRRGMSLILGGLALNLGLNANLLYAIHQGRIQLDPLAFIFGADILPLAGLSVILVALSRMVFKHNALAYSVAALVVAVVTPLLFGPNTTPALLYVVPFFWGDQWWSYFPLFPWLAYPLLGVVLGTSRTIFDAITSLNSRIQIILLLVLCSVLPFTAPFAVQSITELPLYYHHGVLLLLWILGFLAIWLFVFSKLEATWGNSRISRYLKWLGKNVTAAYVFQWLIIGNLATELYRSQSLAQVLVWFVTILFATSLLVVLFRAMRGKILNI
jgi:uncharacterized membrane protein